MMSIHVFPDPPGFTGVARSVLVLLLLTPLSFGAVADAATSKPVAGNSVVQHPGVDPGASERLARDEANATYVCPMHPQIVRHAPGSCPICGMNLVKKLLEPSRDEHPEVHLTPGIVQTMGVRTAPVERGSLSRRIETVGRVEYDETRLVHLHPRADGFIQGLSLRAVGEPVRKDQELAQLYSPAILSAQVDFLLALGPETTKGGVRIRQDKSRNLLRLLAVPEPIIREIEREHETRQTIPIEAPIDGVVTDMTAREGMYVTSATDMFTIADLARVWVLVDVYEDQIDWLAPGLAAEIQVPARPGRTWHGRLDYLYPALDPKSRTLQVRLVFDNPGQLLQPNMFAHALIESGAKPDVLKIPAEALILTGQRQAVILALGDGRFEPVEVGVGRQSDGQVEILSGLNEGDQIVVSGQFLIDSESNLQASFRRLDASAPGDAQPAAQAGGRHVGH